MGDAKVKKIKNQKKLIDELNISSIERIKKKDVREKLFELVRQGRIPDSLLEELIKAVPELAKAFSAYVIALSQVEYQVETTKQARWNFLIECAKQKIFTGEQALEAMKIIQDREKNDPRIDWEKVSDIARMIGASVALAILAIAGGIIIAGSGVSRKG
jgi:hypothetical protein